MSNSFTQWHSIYLYAYRPNQYDYGDDADDDNNDDDDDDNNNKRTNIQTNKQTNKTGNNENNYVFLDVLDVLNFYSKCGLFLFVQFVCTIFHTK